MNKKLAALQKQFSKIGTEIHLVPPAQFLIVGDETLVMGTSPVKVSKGVSVTASKVLDSKIPTESEIQRLFSRASGLRTRSLATFNLSRTYLKRLTSLAKELGSTHVRFFNDADRGIVGRLFDVRIGSDLLLPRNKRIHSAATLDANISSDHDFSATLSIETLRKLPADDLLITVYKDGVLEAEPVNAKFSERYLCRDQGIVEPFTSFKHEKLGRTVYFVYHPND